MMSMSNGKNHKHLRAALYCRVSTREQAEEGYSIEAQLRACRQQASERGWQIVGEYLDEGRSARTESINKRPQFKRLIEDVEGQRIDVVIVHKLDRFARNRRVAFDVFERLNKAGVVFVSLNENMDFSTPYGSFAQTMLVGLAQFYSDDLSQETKKGKRERKAQGLHNGLLPSGAMKGSDGVPVPDNRDIPVNGHSVTNYQGLCKAFEMAPPT